MRLQRRQYPTARVGLDIGSHTVSGVEVVERGSDTVIRSVGSVEIPGVRSKTESPEPGAVAQAIKTLWSKARFQSKAAVLALPPDSTYLKWLHLEAADDDEFDRTARSAAARGAPFPVDDAIVDYRVLSSRGAHGHKVRFVMLVAASSRAIESMLNLAESAGLEPVAIDVASLAATRCFQMQRQSAGPLWSGQPLAHVVVGARNTTITVVRGGDIEFGRTVTVGGADFTSCAAEQLDTNWTEAEHIKLIPGTRLADAGSLIASRGGEQLTIPCEGVVGRLAREIQRSLRFFSSQFAEGSYLGMIGSVTLSGGGALLKGLDNCFQHHGVEVSGAVNPFTGFSVAAEGNGIQHVGDTAPAYTTAMGLTTTDYWSESTGDAQLGIAA